MATTAPPLRSPGRPKGRLDRRTTDGLTGSALQACLDRLAIVLSQGMFEVARRILDSAEQEFNARPEALTFDTPLADTALAANIRLLNQLDAVGILTVRHILNKTQKELGAISGFGPTHLRDVMEFARLIQSELD